MGCRGSVALLLLSAFCSCLASSNYSRSICLNLVQTWAGEELENIYKDESGHLDDLLFFLHIPRTGGRIIQYCLFNQLYMEGHCNSADWQCGNGKPCDWKRPHPLPKNLVPLQSSKQCNFFGSHDDYSVIKKFPRHQTSVFTMMRHPLERILGAYEFSVETAARFLWMKNHLSFDVESVFPLGWSTVTLLNAWPWKYIVPFMRDDILQRDRIRSGSTTSSAENPYNASDFAMPLEEFISAPIAMNMLHNGATLQVAGLTDISHLENAHIIRSCILKYPDLGDYALTIAKRRLDKMPLVGLTEKHKESAVLFAHIFGNQASLEVENDYGNISNAIPMKKCQVYESAHNSLTIFSKATIDEIIYTYESCSNSERKFYSSNRNRALKYIAPLKFSKEARKNISKEIMEEILHLNHLDVQLYEHAQGLFAMKQDDILNNQLKCKEREL